MGIIRWKLYAERQGLQKQRCLQTDAADAACVNNNRERDAADRRRGSWRKMCVPAGIRLKTWSCPRCCQHADFLATFSGLTQSAAPLPSVLGSLSTSDPLSQCVDLCDSQQWPLAAGRKFKFSFKCLRGSKNSLKHLLASWALLMSSSLIPRQPGVRKCSTQSHFYCKLTGNLLPSSRGILSNLLFHLDGISCESV